MKQFFLVLVVLISFSLTSFANEESLAPLFPFAISHDAPENAVNISAWNDAPAGKHGGIRVEDNHFVNDKGRFLIWGTNLCFTASFPEKLQAEKLAAQLARLGFNCVRLHHMDSRDIWGANAGKSLLTIDPQQLDKLDYLIYQLKLNGIYVDINLHVSRMFDDRDGFPHKDQRPSYDKGLDNFYPPFIELQKKYARDLLTHVNPYTKTAYTDEPAVAVVEINNENSIVSEWGGSADAAIMKMPAPYSTEFQKQWNAFLTKKYKTDAALSAAWKFKNEPLGTEMLKGDSESKKWHVEVDADTVCKQSETDGVFRLEVTKHGKEVWHPQLVSQGQVFEAGKIYTFSIQAKANKPVAVNIGPRRNEGDYGNLGFSARLSLTTDWQTFTYTFVPLETCKNARFDINGFSEGFTFEFKGGTLKPGGKIGLADNQTLQAGTIPLVDKNCMTKSIDTAEKSLSLPREARDDFCEFLFDIERTYWLGMYRFLKDELKVKQPISGTQMYYGSATIQAQLDYIDVHAYWNHPAFPGRQWDTSNWYVNNQALVNSFDRDIFPRLGTARPHGKPYTVSEFDAPFPIQYGAEAMPLLAAFGRFQDWDGIFHFAYSHSKGALESNKVGGFFDMVGNTVKLVHQPACVAMFKRGDVAEGKTEFLGKFDADTELALFKRTTGPWQFNFSGIGLDPKLTLLHKTALDTSGKEQQTAPKVPADINQIGDDMFWLPSENNLGRKLLVKSANTKLFTGFGKEGNKHDLGGVELTLGQTRLNWATISLVSLNGNGFDPAAAQDKPIRLLVAATGLMQNSDMTLEDLGNNRITYNNRSGKEPILCEGVPFSLKFAKAKEIRCFPLDEKGNRRPAVKTEGNNVPLGPEHKTVWYEIEIVR